MQLVEVFLWLTETHWCSVLATFTEHQDVGGTTQDVVVTTQDFGETTQDVWRFTTQDVGETNEDIGVLAFRRWRADLDDGETTQHVGQLDVGKTTSYRPSKTRAFKPLLSVVNK